MTTRAGTREPPGGGGDGSRTGLRGSLAAPRLRAAVAAQTTSTTANQIVGLVVPWLVLQRTGDPFAAGLVLLATGSAAVLGTVVGGTMVDRFGARRMSVLSDALSATTLVVIPVGLWTDTLPLWLIVVSQVAGVLFDGPGVVARNTLLAATARHDRIAMTSATSFQKTLQGVAILVGPLAGGFLLAAAGAGAALVVAAALFVAAIIAILRIPVTIAPSPDLEERHSWIEDIREGLRYLRHEELLGPMTLLLGFWVAVAAPMPTLILPAWFLAEQLPASGLGVLLGLQAVGGILGGLFHVAFHHRVRPRVWFLASNLVNVALLAAFTLVGPGSWVGYGALFMSGFVLAGSMPILNAAYYTRAPEELMGRVTGAGWAVVLAALPLASLAMGWLLSITAPAWGMITVITGDLLVVAAFALVPAFRLIDRYR